MQVIHDARHGSTDSAAITQLVERLAAEAACSQQAQGGAGGDAVAPARQDPGPPLAIRQNFTGHWKLERNENYQALCILSAERSNEL